MKRVSIFLVTLFVGLFFSCVSCKKEQAKEPEVAPVVEEAVPAVDVPKTEETTPVVEAVEAPKTEEVKVEEPKTE